LHVKRALRRLSHYSNQHTSAYALAFLHANGFTNSKPDGHFYADSYGYFDSFRVTLGRTTANGAWVNIIFKYAPAFFLLAAFLATGCVQESRIELRSVSSVQLFL
jgi:hypothetical protein